MTEYELRGGPYDGRVQEVPDGVREIHFPAIMSSYLPGQKARNLAELEPEIRIDPETWAIIAPPDLVLTLAKHRYRLADEQFVFVEETNE